MEGLQDRQNTVRAKDLGKEFEMVTEVTPAKKSADL